MGWYGTYINGKPSMKEVKEYIENDIKCTCVALRFGYAICVITRKDIEASRERARIERATNPESKWNGYSYDLENLISIVLWKASNNEIMTKTMEESVGPYIYDVPMKYLKAECKAITREKEDAEKNGKTYFYWREKAIEYMKNKSEVQKKIRKLKKNDTIKTKYGNVYSFTEWAGTHILGILKEAKSGVAGTTYRIPKGRITEIQTA